MVAGVVATVAFGKESSTPDVVVEWVQDDPSSATATPLAETPKPIDVSGFTYPIEDACLPDDDNLMPGAPRDYRNGIHEGVDFYDSDNCAFVGVDTEVVAAKSGIVIRADHDYQELDDESLQALLDLADEGRLQEAEDGFRGRQIWIEHDDTTVTRYAHLSGIVEDIQVGDRVVRGQPVGYVGESGTPESVDAPGTQIHLHFEVRVGNSYLGAGFDPETVRSLYEAAFAP